MGPDAQKSIVEAVSGAPTCKPNGRPAGRITERSFHELKAVELEKSVIFGRIEARMIERLALPLANRFAFQMTAGEHERATWTYVAMINLEHAALIVLGQMKSGVPG